MGFRAITASFQALINEHSNGKIDMDMVEEIEEILEDYCCTLEEHYGIGLQFSIRIDEEDGRLHYEVEPESELDGVLLSYITHHEAQVCMTSRRLQ